ncbi:MAG: hypothetical protein ACTSU4_01550 [Promethearchaeota archaeon]
MKLSLMDLNDGTVHVGNKLKIKTIFEFDEDTPLMWTGVRLITKPPCAKELQVGKKEIFSSGKFEAGTYIREKSLLIKHNVVPTIEKRNLRYILQLLLRKKNPIDPDQDFTVKREYEIIIKSKELKQLPAKPNPISFSISGLNINLVKDIFRPGETIKINYSSENLKELEVRLLQKANLICYCEPYGKSCKKIEELPPSIAGDVKTKSTEKGFLLMTIPPIAEPSHDFLWEPEEREYWGFKFGDYCRWSLLVIGTKRPEHGREKIKFEIPIVISKQPLSEKEGDAKLFSTEEKGTPALFGDISSKFQKRFQMLSIDSAHDATSNSNVYKIKLKNISKQNLEGVTVKLTGLQEDLFETTSNLVGYKEWNKEEEKEIIYETKQNISAIISVIEDNSQQSVRIQTPIAF